MRNLLYFVVTSFSGSLIMKHVPFFLVFFFKKKNYIDEVQDGIKIQNGHPSSPYFEIFSSSTFATHFPSGKPHQIYSPDTFPWERAF